VLGQHPLHVADRSGHPVEPDAGQPDLRFAFPARIGADHDRLVRPGDVAAILGEAAFHADVDRPPQVSGGELGG
jgi:hypothetical protein